MNELTRRDREKLRRESEIIDMAEKLFFENGFENTSINELATASEFAKRTIYKYFVSKEDLFFAVILKGYKNLWECAKQASEVGTTGFEKIKLACTAFLEYSFSNPGLLMLMGILSSVKNKSMAIDTPYRQKFYEYNNQLFKDISQSFELGIKDGTLRSDFEVNNLMYSWVFTVTGFLHMYQTSGKAFIEQTQMNEMNFIKNTFVIIMDSIKPQN